MDRVADGYRVLYDREAPIELRIQVNESYVLGDRGNNIDW